MRKFWGFYDNGKYRVGCDGGTVYVYDQNNNELAKFKDIKYAYKGIFMQNSNIFVVKSTEGSLAIYNLDKLIWIKKIVITRMGAQDEGFAFSQDRTYFYNIEKPSSLIRTQLTEYNTTDFSVSHIYFADKSDMLFCCLTDEQKMELQQDIEQRLMYKK